ncbi:helix-turn-helix domain-containing protein [Nocardiopsis synnemataformans]|uniref:helix-turn-helix domain-containing protein n=1 Tax=Nocardiopsis synnemataformans TaxID=61305 RepID=UPI003EBAADF9
MNTTTAAKQAGITRGTLYTWLRMGAVKATKRAGRWVIDPVSLRRRITLGAKPAPQTTKKVTMKATDIDISVEEGNLFLTAPYNPAANGSYKDLGARWDAGRKAWRFAARDIELVRAAVQKHFGYDDRPVEVVDVRINAAECFDEDNQAWVFGGRRIVHRPGRDEDVRLGKDVLLLEGRFPGSGGSVRYPRIDTDEVVLEVRDVPATHADLKEDGVTIIETPAPAEDTAERAALEAERAQLLARLAEIDAQLAQ